METQRHLWKPATPPPGAGGPSGAAGGPPGGPLGGPPGGGPMPPGGGPPPSGAGPGGAGPPPDPGGGHSGSPSDPIPVGYQTCSNTRGGRRSTRRGRSTGHTRTASSNPPAATHTSNRRRSTRNRSTDPSSSPTAANHRSRRHRTSRGGNFNYSTTSKNMAIPIATTSENTANQPHLHYYPRDIARKTISDENSIRTKN